ncbi:MAG TPA: hypothetical protein VKY74_17645 [Chloroflexia bacterium]|nr:hypothetical protein [Chloroflexia bacterium]
MKKDLEREARKLQAKGQALAEDALAAGRDQALELLGARQSHFWGNLGWLLLGAGLGSLTTYLLDPDRGRRRQALIRDQVVHARTVVQDQVPKKIRHAQNRLHGVQHELGAALHKTKGEAEAGTDAAAESPQWEIAHNDNGSLTGPTY